MGGSRSHSEFFLENHPKIALSQHRYFGVVYHIYSVYTLLKVVSYYVLSVLSMSVMGFQNEEVWMGGGWVGGVSSIQVFFYRFCLKFCNFAKPLTSILMYVRS